MIRKTLALAACLIVAPAIVSAQGMTRVQMLGLQQQLREECGLAHTSGRMDAPTRRAVAVCNKKYGTKDAWSLGRAMNLGWDAGNSASGGMSSSMSSGSGMSMSAHGMSMHDSTMEMREMKMKANRAGARRKASSTQADSVLRADRDAHGHDEGKMTMKKDTAYSDVADSLLRASRGLSLPAPVKPKKKN